jgi:hypothetical protein
MLLWQCAVSMLLAATNRFLIVIEGAPCFIIVTHKSETWSTFHHEEYREVVSF